MKIVLEDGMLYITPQNKKEEEEATGWYDRTYKNYDEMCDFMVYIESIDND